VIRPDGLYESQERFGLDRWHIMDPIRFDQDIKLTIQALGWRSVGPLPAAAGRYLFAGLLGTRPNPMRHFQSCRIRIIWKSNSK
jgi:hypothetical protein